MTKPLVAIDDGYAQIKVFGDNPKGGAPISLSLRTSVRAGRFGLASLAGAATDAYQTEEGEDFTVSNDVAGENTQFDSFHTSTMNRVLVQHALSKAGYGGMEIELMTGLPVADYFTRDSIDEAKIEAKRANLQKGVKRIGGGDLTRIAEVDVGCQAVAAWVDYALDDDLEFRIDASKRVGIIDIGGRTTDIAVIVNGSQIDHQQSGTANVGVLDVYKALMQSIRSKFGIKDDFPTAALDAAVRSGTIELWGKEEDIRDLVKGAVAEIGGKIEREIERRIGNAASLSAAVFVGGGGALFKDIPSRMRNGVLPQDPEFANARGLWKFSRLQRKNAAAA